MSQATLGSAPYLNSNLFSGYYLDERVADRDAWDCDEEAEAVFEELRTLWRNEKTLVDGYNEDTLLGSWIDKVLETLGFDTIQETSLPNTGGFIDRVLFDSPDDRRDAMAMKQDGMLSGTFGRASALLEAKQWGASFEKTFSEQRQYRDASHQVKYYLERTPDSLKWGVLTNGRKWRLYGIKDYETQTYYEVDLPELLESGSVEAFKYFYVFFRPDAFREVSGTSFLDTVWNESETAAQELGEDLQDNVFTALRVLGEGFVETNNLGIDPEDEEKRDELKEQSLVLLYRLMFVLYAESRGLISPDEPGKRSEFEENFSLDELRREIHEEITSGGSFDDFSEFSTSMWGQLEDLFRLVDAGEESLGIPPYNGGLFDRESHEFLAENEVANRYIAEVVYRLGTTHAKDGDGFVLADYADLDTRHLGTIYEGLLEHEFRLAPEQYAAVAEDGGQVWKPATEVSVADAIETVEKGELYVVNDNGERKATGSYYTPDYVVTYIVEETIDPLINQIEQDLNEGGLEEGTQEYVFRFADKVLDLTVLDPAMGSGHFLTKATGYLAERIMEHGREVEETAGVLDEQDIRRRVSRECIYGVDINGMAVELAKLSMWLETLAEKKPLAFLDHHLKDGNSLVGSDITEVLSGDDSDDGDGQITLFQAVARARQRTLEHVMDRISELLAIDNEEYEDIKSMEELYGEIRDDPLYGRLFELANVHTAEQFGLDVPGGVYEKMAGAIEDEDDWSEIRGESWFQSAQSLADKENFFHWELEYPEVFFDSDGVKRSNAGFDAVVGNPPYIKIQNLRLNHSTLADYLVESPRYQSTKARFDIYAPFVEQGYRLSSSGTVTYILPNKFFKSDGGKGLREFLSSKKALSEIVDFGKHQVFDGAITYTCIMSLSGESGSFDYTDASDGVTYSDQIHDLPKVTLETSEFDSEPWTLVGPNEKRVLSQLEAVGSSLDSYTEYLSEGVVSGDNDVLFVNVVGESGGLVKVRSDADGEEYLVEKEIIHPLIPGDGIFRYAPLDTDLAVIYPYKEVNEKTEVFDEAELESKYPRTYEYLSEFKDRLSNRGSESMEYPKWYSLWRPREKRLWESPKLLIPDICERSEFTIDDAGEVYIPNSGYGIVPSENNGIVRSYLMTVLNSRASWFYIYYNSPVLEGDFRHTLASYLSSIPVPGVDSLSGDSLEVAESDLKKKNHSEVRSEMKDEEFVSYLGREMLSYHSNLSKLNQSLLDHFGTYEDGQNLSEIGFTQPPQNAASSILQETAEQKPNLRIGRAEVNRESTTTVEILLTARYKPEEEDGYETDQWGYTETNPLSALRITDLTEEEADLIEAFVPVAVDEAGGFANFRETATKTNSLIDRLRGLVLPQVDDVRDGLKNYVNTVARAEELESKIEQTDDLIDEVVYELYGLTDQDIEVIEEAVDQ